MECIWTVSPNSFVKTLMRLFTFLSTISRPKKILTDFKSNHLVSFKNICFSADFSE